MKGTVMTARPENFLADDRWRRIERVDLVGVLTDAMAMLDRAGTSDNRADRGGALPIDVLDAIRTAGLSALVAHRLLTPGVVTAGLIGADPDAPWRLSALCRAVPSISHVALAPAQPLPARVLDQLDVCGIGVSVGPSVADALLGATLVIATGADIRRVRAEHVASGAVVLNAGPHRTPIELANAAERVYQWPELAPILTGDQPARAHLDAFVLVDPLPERVQRAFTRALAGILYPP